MGASTSSYKDNHKDDRKRASSIPSSVTPSILPNEGIYFDQCRSVTSFAPKDYDPNIRAPAPPHHIPPKRPFDDEESSLDEEGYAEYYGGEQPNPAVPSNDQERYKADAAIASSVSSTSFLQTHHNNDDDIDEPQVQQRAPNSDLHDSNMELSIGHSTHDNKMAAPTIVPPEVSGERMAEEQDAEHYNVVPQPLERNNVDNLQLRDDKICPCWCTVM
ncbi:uncharacterized protein [Watersipora subatra]|uniref:uncharacterized protein n=1 Tax=Watersipora subatra TaxID=2589382 RepID=UPI00355C1C3D